MDLATALTDVFGFSELRPGQGAIIEDVLAGRPTVAVMPTGAGKSLCYQLPGVVLAGRGQVTVVVSPLIALMKDQVDVLRQRGVAAAALTSANSPQQQADIITAIGAGDIHLLYVAPERFRSPRFTGALEQLGDRLGLLAIDEAHCISEWGHEFRPDYRRLGDVVRTMAPPRLVALTATATPEVRDDIGAQLDMRDPAVHVHGFNRPNLCYRVAHVGGPTDKARRLVELVRTRSAGTAIVYAGTRNNAETYADALSAAGMRAVAYHAGLAAHQRTERQDLFMGGELDAVVATNAFGMGVDKADIYLVVHADLPRSVEAYYQESGRGGRDGKNTNCILLFNHSDVRLQEFLINTSHPSAAQLRDTWRRLSEGVALPQGRDAVGVDASLRILERHGYAANVHGEWRATKPDDPDRYAALDPDAAERRAQVERDKLQRMVRYAYHPGCRRSFVLGYFGDPDGATLDRCDGCDNCLGEGPARKASDQEQADALLLLQLVDVLGGRFGKTRIGAIANGTDDDHRFAALPQRGSLAGRSARYIAGLLTSLDALGLVQTQGGEYPTIDCTRTGRDAIHDGELPEFNVVSSKTSSQRRRAPAPSGADNSPLAKRLRSLRTELAREHDVPPFRVFSNKTLRELAHHQPTSRDQLAEINGIGPAKLDLFGDQILAALRDANTDDSADAHS